VAGRALGRQADHASFLSAYGIAKHSLSEMQTAVKLNPKNGPALSDLGDYYALAPGIAGGGTDKAQAIASQLDTVDSARAQSLRGDIAMAQKDYTTAENKYRQAATVASEPADYWTVLAEFYRKRQRWSDLDAAIQNCVSAEAKNRKSGVGLYDGAGVLIAANRNSALASQMLENYLSSSSMTRMHRHSSPTFDFRGSNNSSAMLRARRPSWPLPHKWRKSLIRRRLEHSCERRM